MALLHSLFAGIEQGVVQHGVLRGVLVEAPLHGVGLVRQVDLKCLPV